MTGWEGRSSMSGLVLGSVAADVRGGSDGFQSSWFALPAIHLMSCGHCAGMRCQLREVRALRVARRAASSSSGSGRCGTGDER